MSRTRCLPLLALSLAFMGMSFVPSAYAQDTAPATPAQEVPAAKRTLKPEDYKQWESLAGFAISNDGRFLTYGIRKVDADGYLVVRNVDGPENAVIPNATRGAFSDTSKFAAYIISLPKVEVDKNTEARKPSPSKLGIRFLANGQEMVIDDISRFQFVKDTDLILAVRPKKDPAAKGADDLLLIDCNNGETQVFSNVGSYVLNDAETLAVLTIDTGSDYHSLQLLDVKGAIARTLYTGKEDVGIVSWADKADVFAAAIALPEDAKLEGKNHRLMRVTVAGGKVTREDLNPTKWEGFPKGMRIAEPGGLSLSEDGSSVAFGLQPWAAKLTPGNPKDRAGVEVWHTKDIRPMPAQKKQLGRTKSRTALYTWQPSAKKLNKISPAPEGQAPDDEVSVSLSPDHRRAVITDGNKYAAAVTNGLDFADVSWLDVESGKVTPVIVKSEYGGTPSITGRYLMTFDDKFWTLHDVETNKKTLLKPSARVSFEDDLDDHTIPMLPPVERPEWLDDDKGVIIYDRYDAWLVDPATGKMTRLTQGRESKNRYRLETSIRPWNDHISLEEPMYFTALNTIDKKSSLFLADGKGGGKTLIADDVVFSGLRKAKDADRMTFIMQSFEKSPNIFVTNQQFTQAKPVTKTNAQQVNFLWGKTQLVQFKSRWGVELQGTLIYPADYQAGKKYPMVTYIYERLSDGKNNYSMPSDWSAYNAQHLSQNGYFVFMPDIAYHGNRPGESAVDCLEPAVDAAVKLNVGIDAKKVGLIGHSWGAYQTAFVTTVSDRFAVGACGAPLTELTSMYNSYYWNSGSTDQVIFESSQGRMRVPFWEDPKAYIDNSPVWQSAKRKVPLLMAFGDQDGAVDWHQGIYLYNTLRRMGKDCVMLVYEGENHGLAKRPNQLDYARRLRHWLDVSLKGVKPEPWVKDGVPYVKQIEK